MTPHGCLRPAVNLIDFVGHLQEVRQETSMAVALDAGPGACDYSYFYYYLNPFVCGEYLTK
jgi:hypothetical protein